MEKEVFKSKYHREEPTINFDPNQTMYDAVFKNNSDNMDANYANYFSKHKSYKELKEETDKLAVSLLSSGVKKEEKVAVLALNTPEVASILLGINKIGAVSYWLDASAPASVILGYLKKYNIKKLFVFEPLLPIIENILPHTELDKIIVIPMPSLDKKDNIKSEGKIITYSDFINHNMKDNNKSKFEKDKPSIIIQSSGSTGVSKSLVHTDFNFNNEILKMAYMDLPLVRDKKTLICVPPWIIYGLCNSLYSSLMFGEEAVYAVNYTEDMVYKNLGKYNFSYGVPVCYRYLYNKMEELKHANTPEAQKQLKEIYEGIKPVDVFLSGGDKMTEEDIIKYQHMFNTPIVNGYGNNELVGAAIVSPLYANKPGSIGVPIHGNNVKTFNPDTDEELENGEIGLIKINSESAFLKYLNQPEETKKIKQTINGEEWVDTGDLGYIDSDGYVYITGRNRYLIIDKNGFKISPESSENYIQSLPYVKECAVVGVEVAENDKVPMAFIELEDEYKDNPDIIDQIEELSIQNLKEYERPKLFKEIEKIPHKVNGGKRDNLLLENMAKEYVQNGKGLVLKKEK